jgi:hypothetical protein
VKDLDKFLDEDSLITNVWTSYQNVIYPCLTAYHMDEVWASQDKILNPVTIQPLHTGGTYIHLRKSVVWDCEVGHHRICKREYHNLIIFFFFLLLLLLLFFFFFFVFFLFFSIL